MCNTYSSLCTSGNQDRFTRSGELEPILAYEKPILKVN